MFLQSYSGLLFICHSFAALCFWDYQGLILPNVQCIQCKQALKMAQLYFKLEKQVTCYSVIDITLFTILLKLVALAG